MTEHITVEVVFAEPERQKLVSVELEQGASVADALAASGLARDFRDAELDGLQAGIWGRLADRHDVVRDGDRVEVYRELVRDPKEARRELARAQRLGSSS